MILLFL